MKQWGATACRLSLALSVALGGAAIAQGDAKTDPRDLTPYLVPAGATPTTPDAEGFIRRWLLLEPIVKPNRSNAGFTDSYVREALTTRYFPDQFTIVPRDGQTVQAAEPLKWHAYHAKLFDVKLFNFAQALGKPTYGVIFWAITIVDAPRDIENVRLAVGSNSASMWWVNGAETVGLFDDRRMVMDDVVSKPLTLRKGRNIIRGAVINGPGLSDFCLRFIDDQGKPLRDITIDIK